METHPGESRWLLATGPLLGKIVSNENLFVAFLML
jgi:hypothetical protein